MLDECWIKHIFTLHEEKRIAQSLITLEGELTKRLLLANKTAHGTASGPGSIEELSKRYNNLSTASIAEEQAGVNHARVLRFAPQP